MIVGAEEHIQQTDYFSNYHSASVEKNINDIEHAPPSNKLQYLEQKYKPESDRQIIASFNVKQDGNE